MWPDTRLIDLLGIELPIIQAPMAGACASALAIAVSRAGGLGSLPTAMLSPDGVRAEAKAIRDATDRPYNLNFFAHKGPSVDEGALQRWLDRLAPYYREHNLEQPAPVAPPPLLGDGFGPDECELVEELRPPVVSFHFGLPEAALLDRVKATGAKVISSATSPREAAWLEQHGADAIIAQGVEAGGHRGIFLESDMATQAGTVALVPQVVDAVSVPVIAAGGIADGRGIAAAFALGAAGVQVGTAYLLTPESLIGPAHREALRAADANATALTNVFSGGPARGVANRIIREAGPLSDDAPPFPLAGVAVAPLRQAAEEKGATDFSSHWSGQGAALAREVDAQTLTSDLAAEALARLASLGRQGIPA